MKGRIKMYNGDRGFGFITAEDGNEYFFHISDVRSMVDITRGMIISFEGSRGPKGLVAKEIVVNPASPVQPEFIAIGDKRIKIRNIKSYEITNDMVYRHVGTMAEGLYSIPCLVISTYQNDAFVWWEDTAPFDIHEEFKRIDEIMTGVR